MSHAVKIDYQGISIQCQSICKMASSQLCKLDSMLDTIESSSKSLLNSQTEALRKEVVNAKAKLQAKIDAVVRQARINENKGRVVVDSDFMGEHINSNNVIYEAEQLEKMVTELADTKLMEIDSILSQLMSGRLESHQNKLRDLALGKTYLNVDVQKKIDSMTDEIMRQYVYIAWVNEPYASFDTLLNKAVVLKTDADKQHTEKEEKKKLDEIRKELKVAKVDDDTIEKIVDQDDTSAKERLRKAREQANAEIVGEDIRRESVKIIVQAIRKRGFFVDAKSIRIDKSKNQVNIVAQKPSGAKAEFKVYLDGKFEYRFDGYEGQACQKDIQPFMDDLENIYGIKVVNQTEIWSNPDKISTMKYQTMNHNTNRE